MHKYDWSKEIIAEIAWEAHGKEIQQYPRDKAVTLFKYIHGWLANGKRRFREKSITTAQCPLCGKEETRDHMLRCDEARMRHSRGELWKTLCTKISNTTEADCRAVFMTGLRTIIGDDPPQDKVQQDWPSELRAAYDSQAKIGWSHVLYGRVSCRWESLAQTSDRLSCGDQQHVWTRKVIRSCWRFGLDLWQTRNVLIHGTDGAVSTFEQQIVK